MKALVFQAITAVAVPYTAFAQQTDYRVTESTQACARWDMVHASVQNAKRAPRPGIWRRSRCPFGGAVLVLTRNDAAHVPE
ncbi:MAG TPA: hypothetical protein VK657_01390 [Terriglobales bacterium]|nr:hypothetical protein [Terriglobales bacterium]